MRHFKTLTAVITLVFAGALSNTAVAAIIDNGGYTTDTTTSLDWLDLSATDGLSIAGALASNVGWSLASRSDVNALFLHMGFATQITSPSFQFFTPGLTLAQSSAFITLFGATQFGFVSQGWYDDPANTSVDFPLNHTCISTSSGFCFGSGYSNGVSSGVNANIGTYLVRDNSDVAVIPLPGAVWLMGSGLLGLLGLGRKNKAHAVAA